MLSMLHQSHSALGRILIVGIAIGGSLFAQATSTPATNAAKEEATVLSVFKVSSTQDKGYIVTRVGPRR